MVPFLYLRPTSTIAVHPINGHIDAFLKCQPSNPLIRVMIITGSLMARVAVPVHFHGRIIGFSINKVTKDGHSSFIDGANS